MQNRERIMLHRQTKQSCDPVVITLAALKFYLSKTIALCDVVLIIAPFEILKPCIAGLRLSAVHQPAVRFRRRCRRFKDVALVSLQGFQPRRNIAFVLHLARNP